MLKKSLWHGLSLVFAMLLVFAIIVSMILETFRSAIDGALGTTSEILVSDESEGELYTAYTPEEKYLTSSGGLDTKKFIQGAIELNRQQGAEGSVLLKNTSDNALPIAKGSKVTLLGMRSHVPLLGSAFGVKVQSPVITLEDALSKNRTDFANRRATEINTRGVFNQLADGSKFDNYDFDGAGLQLNQTMIDVYDSLAGENYAYNEGARNVYDPKEPSLSDLAGANANYKDSFKDYNDAAIVVVGRPGGESTDYLPGGVVEGTGAEEPLELTTNERDAIKLATDNFDKVIVILNNTSPMEIEELKNNDKIDAILWIGFPGCYGMLGVADVISGKVSPSGALPDTYAVKNMSSPAMMNMGDFTFANADDLTRKKSSKYVVEAEGIYTGYHYYETRYYDSVLNRGDASSTVGAYGSTGAWTYGQEVSYTFGYGESYTTFSQEIVGTPVVTQKAHEITVDVTVKVTNTGKVDAKTPVQVYAQAPYTPGGVEKTAITILGFGKTGTIKAGASEEVTVHCDLQDLASYDSTHDNGDGTKGTYIFDSGDYYFAVGNGAHEALNNILAAQGITPSSNPKMDAAGETSAVWKWNYQAEEGKVDTQTFSVSKHGVKISNQIPYADWNYYQPGAVTYLSRNNWSGTYPKTYSNMTIPASMMDDLNGKYYTIKTDQDTSDYKWGQEGDLNFYDFVGVEYDNPQWDKLLEQVTFEEAMTLAAYGGPVFPSVESVGFQELYLLENCGNGMVLSFNNTKDPNSPWTVSENDNNYLWNPQVFACSPLVAASFNTELMNDLGKFVGQEALVTGLAILWGPGLNTHRHAYNGRTCEYYSEDALLSGYCALEFSIGALDFGLLAAPKHFAFNDQETNRSGVAPFMTEQRAREIELRAYQIAFEANKYDEYDRNGKLVKDVGMIGLMTSFSKIGGVECLCSRGLMTNILKEEWGFHGYAVTDIFDDTDCYTAGVYAGITGWDIRGASGFYDKTTVQSRFTDLGEEIKAENYAHDADMQQAFKDSVHNTLWAFCQTNLVNRYNASSHLEWQMTWWRGVYIAAIVVFSVVTVACVVLYVVSLKKEEK